MARLLILPALVAIAAAVPALGQRPHAPRARIARRGVRQRSLSAIGQRRDRGLRPPPRGGALPHSGAFAPRPQPARAGLGRPRRDDGRGFERGAAEQLLDDRQLRAERVPGGLHPPMVCLAPRQPGRTLAFSAPRAAARPGMPAGCRAAALYSCMECAPGGICAQHPCGMRGATKSARPINAPPGRGR